MIPLCVPNLTGNEARYLQECIETTFVSTVGAFVGRLEEMVGRATGAAHVSATSAGTTGLHLALATVGVAAGDLVALPAFTFIASANAISHAGATPWLFDVDPGSWTLDPVLLRRELERSTRREGDRLIHLATGRRVSCVMPVHTLGMPADMDAIVAVAREFGLPVVADSAAALGATYKGRPIGRLGADLSVVSFNGNKTITAGGGGAVLGEDAGLVGLARHLAATARVGSDYDHDRVGFNYRMTNLEAAVGCAQMERLDEFVAAKRRIQRTYAEALGGLPGVGLPPAPSWAESACWFSVITLDAARHADPAGIRARLRAAGIDARPFWKPVHLQVPYAGAPRTAMDVCEPLWKRVLTLPCSTHLSAADQATVIAAVTEALA